MNTKLAILSLAAGAAVSGCSGVDHGSIANHTSNISIEVPRPGGASVVAVLAEHEQRTFQLNFCAALEASAESWTIGLKNSGFLVEQGQGVIDTGSGRVFALRFRREGVYGDLISWPSPTSPVCRIDTLRLQRALKPERWHGEFGLSSLFLPKDIVPNYDPPPFFPASRDFPPGYP